MDAKLSFNGIEITVPIAGLADALRQLERLNSDAPREVGPPLLLRRRARIVDDTVASGDAQMVSILYLRSFLEVLAEHHMSGGISPDEVGQTLGVEHLKGIGSKMAGINSAIRGLGLQPAEVYSNDKRSPDGRRIWTAGPQLKVALSMINQRIHMTEK